MVQGRAHSGRGLRKGGSGGVQGALPSETKHLHTCWSIFNFAFNLVHERFEDANKKLIRR